MRLHTGETLATATEQWTWEQREQLGQRYLFDLAQDVLRHFESMEGWLRTTYATSMRDVPASLALDGYTYSSGMLHRPDSDVLDVKEQSSVLQSLFRELVLGNEETAFHHLALSETHFIAGR